MLPPHWFSLSVPPGLPILIPLAFPLNIPTIYCEVGVVPVLALLARSAAVTDTDLEAVQPTIDHGVPGCNGGFDVVVAATSAATSAAAPLCGEVGDDGKDPGDLGVARREGGKEGQVGDDKPLYGVIIMDGRVCKVV